MARTSYKAVKEKIKIKPKKGNFTVFDSIRKSLSKPYFKAKNFLLYHSDVVEMLSFFPKECVDLIFADPPYMLSNDGFTCHAGKRVSVNKGKWDKSQGLENDFSFHRAWIKACRRILKPSGTIWISGTYHSIYSCAYALQLEGFHILNNIAWYKPNASPNLSCRYFTASHETLIWARKNKKGKHTFNYKFMKEGNWNSDFLKKPNKQMRSVWAIGTPKPEEKRFGKHPTQKPLELLKRIILASSNKGDIVLDPFTGSTTTGLVAYEYDRKFIGIDIEKRYLDLSIKRFKELERNIKSKLF